MQKGVRCSLGSRLARRGTAGLEDSLYVLFDLLILVIAGSMLFRISSALITNPAVEQRYVATELALLLDAMQAAPGNVQLLYQTKLDLSAEVQEGKNADHIIVTPRETAQMAGVKLYPGSKYYGETPSKAISTLFHADEFLVPSYRRWNTNTPIVLSKVDGELRTDQLVTANVVHALPYAAVDTEKAQRVVMVDAEPGAATQVAAQVIEGHLLEGSLADKQQQAHGADIIVMLRATDGDRPVLFIAPNAESRKLASLMLRELQRDWHIVPLSPQYLTAGDGANLLTGRIGVMVAMRMDAVGEIGTAINRAVNSYFRKSFTLPPSARAEWRSEVIGDARVITS